ncbi:hypothetical protein [Microbulbifer sp. TYP-18]|uniref:hypothetical protein n=1 Tax=Microbulbifer sp. TYP-18 TaxID=3230024 RepID=UPI0034C627E9
MKKILTALSFTMVATLGFVSTANAETWSPVSTTDIVMANTVGSPLMISKGITLLCDMNATIDTDAAGNAQVTSLILSDPGGICAMIVFVNFPYEMVGGDNDLVTIKNVDAQGVTGNCFGDLTGTLNQATGEITFVNAEIPSNPPDDNPCIGNGVVGTTPAMSYTLP